MRLLITQTPASPITRDAQNRRCFTTTVSFEGYNTYPVTLTDPFTPAEEAELEWYYERWLNFPFTDKIRAQHAAESIRTYGHNLFEQLFQSNVRLYAEYDKLRGQEFTIEIIGEPEFHTLHWESLHDRDQDRPLTVDKAIIRRNHKPITTPATVKPSPTLNILLVTARPGGKLDVGYRTISRPLVDALENSQLPTRVDIVRPGTFRALVQHLEDSRDKHGDGYYHVIHLDMHGMLLTYEEYQKAELVETLRQIMFKGDYGQEPVTKYEGVKAFLAFNGEKGGTDLVSAADLAKVLNTRQVPIAILNACQSGKQVGAEETSLGSRLLTAGVQLVVAMGYSVTVSAAKLLMTHLYQHLLHGDSLETAIRRARLELYHDKTRRAAYSQQIELEDWLLPVVYQHRPVSLPQTAFDWTTLTQETAAAHRPPRTNYGFVGRDVDILEVEQRLLRDEHSNLLLVRGMGGAGKTTLLHHLAWWWQKTRLVNRVFYFGYDVKAYHTQEIVATMALALFGKVDVPWLAVRQKLRAERHLLILDNMESITGERLAVQNTLPPAEQAALRAFLADLLGGKTLILLGSRSDEQWLVGSGQHVSTSAGQHVSTSASQHVSSEQSVSQSLISSLHSPLAASPHPPLAASPHPPVAASLSHLPTYDLPGLDPEAQSELAEAILGRLGKRHYRSAEPHREPFQQLLKLLGGYPLALEVVLNNLHHQTPAQVLDALTQADVNLDTAADTGDKTKSILHCIDYSHGNLSPLAQDVLLCLAPFTGVVNASWLPQYTAQLQKAWAEMAQGKPGFSEKPGFLMADTAQWQAVLQEAARWGLVANHEIGGGYLRLQPVLPYFLKTRLHDPAQAARQQVIETAFREHYQQVGEALHQLITSKQPQERQTGQTLIGLEYENLWTSVKLAIISQNDFYHAYSALSDFNDSIQQHDRAIALGEFIADSQKNYSEAQLAGHVSVSFYAANDWLANNYLHVKNHEAAQRVYKNNLLLAEKSEIPRIRSTGKAGTLHQLGMVAQEQRQWDAAADYYRQALQIQIKFNDRHSQALTLWGLGMIAAEEKKWDAAADYYRQALQIFIEFQDRYNQGKVLHQLGLVAQEQRQWDAAADYFRQALQIKIEFNDRYSQASTLHQLGMVAEEQRQWDAAADYFRQALQIKIEFNDRYSQASTLHMLGIVAQEQRQWDAAADYFRQALQIQIEFNDRYSQASTLHQLGRVAQEQRQWDAAADYFRQSLQIKIEFNDRYNQAMSLHHLGMVAQEQRQWDAAADYFRQALQIYIEFNDRYEQAGTLHMLGMVAQEQRQWDAAADYFRQALQIQIEFNDRYSQGATLNGFGQIAEAQEQWETAANYYLDAIQVYAPYQDHNFGIVFRNLARVWQASGQGADIPARLAGLLGVTPAQAEERLRAALAG